MRRSAAALLALVVVAGARAGVAAAQPQSIRFNPVLVSVVETRADLTRALKPLRPIVMSAQRHRLSSLPTIKVDSDTTYQRIRGFGAAMTDTSAWLIGEELTPSAQNLLMEGLFSPKVGIGLRFLRIAIGGTDFNADGQPYTYDDQPAGASDPGLAGFSISHDLPYLVPLLRQAVAIDPGLWTMATPWSAPPWMKSNDAFGNYPIGSGSLQQQYRASYAQYFVKFLQAYAAQGIPIDALTIQNEPTNATFPGTEMTSGEAGTFISSYLAPALQSAGLGQVKLFGWDGGGEVDYPEQLLAGPAADQLSGFAWHCYGAMADMLRLADEDPYTEQVVSECSPGIIPYSPAEALIDAARHGASAAGLWNIALDPKGGPVVAGNPSCGGCSGLVTIDEASHTVSLGRSFYELGQLSELVQPGAIRIASSRLVNDYAINGTYGVSPGLDDVAFQNPDGSIVVVVHNSGNWTRFRLSWDHRSLSYVVAPGATTTFSWPTS